MKSATDRATDAVAYQMKRGLGSLATIAGVAPLLGWLIMCFGIVGSFGSVPGAQGSGLGLALVTAGLANAISRGALGLFVGILARWIYLNLRGQMDLFEAEMKMAALDLAVVLRSSPFGGRLKERG